MTQADFTPDFVERPFWLDDYPLDNSRPVVELPKKIDVLVVGGGYTGLSAAATTVAGGRSTLVVDAQSLGFGCSARNGGQVATSLKPSFQRMRTRFGDTRGRAVLQEGIEALEGLRCFVKDQSIDCDWQPVGRFLAAHSAKHFRALQRAAAVQSHEFDQMPVSVISKDDQRAEIGTDSYYGGVIYPRHAAVHPAKLLHGLHEIARAAGVNCVWNCAVRSIERDQDHYRVFTECGTVKARDVIVATNGYTDRFSPWHRRRIIPIRSHVIATEPLAQGMMAQLLPSRRVVTDTRKLMVYYRSSPDGRRIIFGGRASLFDAPVNTTAPRLLTWLRRIFPELEGFRVSHAWSGIVAYTFDELPHFGRHDGVHYCMGYCGSGISLSIHFGRKIGWKVLGSARGNSPLDDIPFPTRVFYTGHPWFLAPSILTYRLRDALNV